MKALASIAVLGVALSAATVLSVSSGSLATTFHNIQDAYKNYGFAYCFACSVVDRGISEPDDYSSDSIGAIVDEIEAKGGNAEVVRSDHATEGDTEYHFPADGIVFRCQSSEGSDLFGKSGSEFHLDERELYIWFPDDAVFRRRHCEYGI